MKLNEAQEILNNNGYICEAKTSIETKIKKDLLRTKNDLKYFKGGNWSISLYNVLNHFY